MAIDKIITPAVTDDSITAAKINNDIISGSTELAAEPADTDEFLVSDAGTLKRVDYTHIKGLADTNQAIVKGWVSFNGTGTVAINNSYNCSSITDNGTGSYAINWSAATGATGSNHASGGGGDKSGYNNNERTNVFASTNNKSTLEHWNGTTATDCNIGNVLTFGNGS